MNLCSLFGGREIRGETKNPETLQTMRWKNVIDRKLSESN